MSFQYRKTYIEEGDIVFAWISRSYTKPITVTKDGILNTRYGTFPYSSMIGKKYGEQIGSSTGHGFIYLLHPSPELWTLSLPHRTQILYTPDISYIQMKLNMKPGSRVIEAGTGSGSFTHSLSRVVAEKGKVYSFEFHEHRYQEALKEFTDHRLDNVQLTHRDVCDVGFSIDDMKQRMDVDAIFLDLPSTWTAITNLEVEGILSKDKKVGICCFNPCIEQVSKTIDALKANGWNDIEMVEINFRKHESHLNMVRDVNDVIHRLKDIQGHKMKGLEKVRKVKEALYMKKAENSQSTTIEAKNEADKDLREENGLKSGQDEESEIIDNDFKKIDEEFKTIMIKRFGGEKGKRLIDQLEKENEQENAKKRKADESKESASYNPFGKGQRISPGDPNYKWKGVSRDEAEVKSHTSFLTFAFKNVK